MTGNNDPVLSLLGLARKAGRLSLGFDSVCDSVRKGEARLVLVTSDASAGTMRKLRNHLGEDFTQLYTIPYDINRMDAALGKGIRLLSVNDKGFAQRIRELLQADGGAQFGQGEEKSI